jgi:hypothetical protein
MKNHKQGTNMKLKLQTNKDSRFYVDLDSLNVPVQVLGEVEAEALGCALDKIEVSYTAARHPSEVQYFVKHLMHAAIEGDEQITEDVHDYEEITAAARELFQVHFYEGLVRRGFIKEE